MTAYAHVTTAPATAQEKLGELGDRFRSNINQYKNPNYNEENTRADFIDKFFALLGWDMDNTAGTGERYREVIREKSIRIDYQRKAPDYAFRVGELTKFFVEAKKPSVIIKDDALSAFQLRRYGFSVELPLSILTNFAEFAVYNTKIKLTEKDTASTARIFYCTYDQFFDRCSIPGYATNFDYIDGIFSRKNVWGEKFDDYADSDAIKRGTSPVDKELLLAVEKWRETLAVSIAKRNPTLDVRYINIAVQKIIDRILFLRIAEGRRIERYENLLRATQGAGVYNRLQELFIDADKKYNAGLFERQHWLENIIVDDKVIAPVIKGLYGEKCPYAFEAIPIEILGSIYERLLGKTILLTTRHKATVDYKPEVRKAGGVFYTPQYIVDYIVQETIGRKIVPSKPIPTLTILDPACGSGSFLIGAYSFLLKTYLSYYTHNEKIQKKSLKSGTIYEAGANTYRLSIEEKQRILLNNIFGVDIDPIAVEVAKLSLYLKLMEDETAESCENLFRYSDMKALPNIDKNIRCGNSLIESDFYNGNKSLFDDDAMQKVNAFDWKKEFPAVFKSGGFDVVIGNPPYVQQSMTEYFSVDVAEYLKLKYSSSMGRLNTFGFFIERSFSLLLKKAGGIGIIIPNTILTQEYYQSLRKSILKHRIDSLTQFSKPVFTQAVVETVIFVASAEEATKDHDVDVIHYDNRNMEPLTSKTIRQNVFLTSHSNAFLTETTGKLLKLKRKIEKQKIPLGQIVNINQAIALKHDRSLSLFRSKKGKRYKPVIDGRHISRYSLHWGGDYLAYDVNNIHSCKRTDIFEASEKILFRRVGDRLIATYDNKQFYALNTLVVITPKNTGFSVKLLLAIFNSTLLNFYYQHFLKSTKKVFSENQARQVAQLPIPMLETIPAKSKSRLVELVDHMLIAQVNLRDSATDLDRQRAQQRVTILDGQIDKAVYELYGLTEEESRIVETG